MSQSKNLTLEQIKLSLGDYQSELSAIDRETVEEKERILNAIQAEETEIKSLLEQYRRIKRQKEIEVIESSYNHLTDFKKNLLSKIDLEKEEINKRESELQSVKDKLLPTMEGGVPKKISKQLEDNQGVNQKIKIIELINFIAGIDANYLVKLYPADVQESVPTFEVSNTIVKKGLLDYYKQRDKNIYNALLKLYQKPQLNRETINIPPVEKLSLAERKYHDFLESYYSQSLPFFWFLVNREKDSIKQIVMEFAVDHIIQTNTLETDLNRQELTLELREFLEMNDRASIEDYLRDVFLCFHPYRVNQKSTSRNKYFDYVNKIIENQSSLENSEIIRNWNYMLKCGYEVVSSPGFAMPHSSANNASGLISGNQDGLL